MSPAEAEAVHKKTRASVVKTNVVIYVLFALLVAFMFWLNAQQDKDDLKKRCQGGVDTRTALRSQAQAIYKLNLSFIDPKRHYTKEEQKQIKPFIRRVTKFRDEQYALIKPSTACLPYVNDDRVKPPRTPAIKNPPPAPQH